MSHPKHEGPSIRPATISPTTGGWPRGRNSHLVTRESATMTATWSSRIMKAGETIPRTVQASLPGVQPKIGFVEVAMHLDRQPGMPERRVRAGDAVQDRIGGNDGDGTAQLFSGGGGCILIGQRPEVSGRRVARHASQVEKHSIAPRVFAAVLFSEREHLARPKVALDRDHHPPPDVV